jgi:hypothetical protein
MLDHGVKVYYIRCTYPCELLRYLNESAVLDKIDVIHISSHGDVDRGNRAVIAPKLKISPYEAVELWLWFYKKIVNDGYGVVRALNNAKNRTDSHGGMCVTFAP